MADNVNHPSHYKGKKFECIEVMQEIYGADATKDFCLCNAFKYLYRCMNKNGAKEDVEKAIWYCSKWLELEEDSVDIEDATKYTIETSPLNKPGPHTFYP